MGENYSGSAQANRLFPISDMEEVGPNAGRPSERELKEDQDEP